MEIVELTLHASHLSELKQFYGERLRLPLTGESGASFSFRAGNTNVTFVRTARDDDSFYHFAFNIPENKIEEAAGWLRDRVELLGEKGDPVVHFESWNAHAVYFKDPAGNIVELIARHNLENASQRPFGEEDFLCVSEIGMPVDDVSAALRDLKRQAGLDAWKTPSDTFAPVGDENGLFIVVKKGRVWFAGERSSHPYPLAVRTDGCRVRLGEEEGISFGEPGECVPDRP
ncbi:glyoxalase/bleomycin resistance/dioxygenase family protein [Paenibacillus chitinolyticus]|uniref:VOC family protein n=1 Tax=Paenibacillus chitinolyticus TaxID=79263 RepID=UPI002DB7AD80|nr:glyoxalase/bleomycin resistance/dioxygenase family protein [Paenibacillus chitinolyticus]MEC0245250.1 glyoxalase/bleomycin resistance/dioxygenase family protein [Paenibacillus chitinolyticus]